MEIYSTGAGVLELGLMPELLQLRGHLECGVGLKSLNGYISLECDGW